MLASRQDGLPNPCIEPFSFVLAMWFKESGFKGLGYGAGFEAGISHLLHLLWNKCGRKLQALDMFELCFRKLGVPYFGSL